MLSKEWWIEHFVEVISLIVSGVGFFVAGKYLIKINNQKASIVNSPNSPLIQVNGDNNKIGSIQSKLNKKLTPTQSLEEVQETSGAKELLKKLDEFIDENKPVSSTANLALRLAEELKMSEDVEWLSKEVNGFHEIGVDYKKGLKFQKSKESDRHRSVVAELNLESKNGKLDSLSIPLFISQSIYDIENWISQTLVSTNQSLFILKAPPPSLLVEELNVDPNEKIPYILPKGSLEKIINGVKIKIIDFSKRAKQKLKR